MRTFEKILVAVDREDQAETPIRFALDLARRVGAEIIVFHSISDKEVEDREQLPAPANYLDFMMEETERELAELVKSLAGDGETPAVRVVARTGDPAEEILALAEKEDCDLCVIGLRRRSRVGKFLLGSRLQDVLMSTDRPVVAVPIEDEAAGEPPSAS